MTMKQRRKVCSTPTVAAAFGDIIKQVKAALIFLTSQITVFKHELPGVHLPYLKGWAVPWHTWEWMQNMGSHQAHVVLYHLTLCFLSFSFNLPPGKCRMAHNQPWCCSYTFGRESSIWVWYAITFWNHSEPLTSYILCCVVNMKYRQSPG